MSVGRDVREKGLTMAAAPVDGGLEPLLLPTTRQEVRSQVAARIAAYVPEWTNRRPDDAGGALVRVHGTLAEAVNLRINRVPRRLALDHLGIAGVRALHARPADAVLAIEVGRRAPAPVVLPSGSAFVAQSSGDLPVVLETMDDCVALPGTLAALAVLTDGWLVDDDPSEPGSTAPFGPHPTVPAELWFGVDSPVAPAGLLSVAVELVPAREREACRADATEPASAPPTLRWEAMTSAGPAELAVERDGTAALTQNGVLALRVDVPAPWAPRTLPGRADDAPRYWFRARLTTADFPPSLRLSRVVLNGVRAIAARSVRGEALEPIDRPVTGRSRYRLSQIPVVVGSVLLDVTDASSDVFGEQARDALTTLWTETDDLAALGPADQRFLLDASTGIVTFGDGTHGRAVPEGFRNVVARVYATGGGTTGLPRPGDAVNPRRSVPNLTRATVVAITTGADAETADELVRRGPAELRSRGRAVAPNDYATMALQAEGVDIARAHCLPGRDPRSAGAPVPGVVGVIVVPQVVVAGAKPVATPEALRSVAEHLARDVGVVGAEVIVAGPTYRELAVQAVLVARAGEDLAAAGSAVRDAIDEWLDPIRGAGGVGWPFGAPVEWDALARLLLREVPPITAVPRLSLRLDGRRLPSCTDAVIDPGELIWPGLHLIEVLAGKRSP